MTITIDPEFKSIIPPLSPEEFIGLDESIRKEGCRDPIVLWNELIIDGHNRFKICNDYNIPFKTIEMYFTERSDAKIWMIKNQFSRRNLNAFQRSELALVMEPLFAERAKENQIRKVESAPQISAEQKLETRKEVAKIAGVSHDTISKVKKIKERASTELLVQLRDTAKTSAKTSINKVYNEIKKEEKLQENRLILAQKTSDAQKLPDTITLYHGNFLTDFIKLDEGSIDCIITDPPYVKEWLDNYGAFAEAAAYVLKPGGFLITYIGHIHMDKILAQMTPHLEYYWIAMLKHAGTNAAVHSRSVQCGMKPILIFNKSPRMKPKRYFNDIIIGTGKEKDAHEWQQGEEELRQIFEPFTDPGDIVLDPFMGSGTTLSMAKKLNRVAIGFDIDKDNVDIVRGRLCH